MSDLRVSCSTFFAPPWRTRVITRRNRGRTRTAPFDNGAPVPDIARSLYLELGDGAESYGEPLQTAAPHSYFQWLNENVDGPAGGVQTVTRLWQAVYRTRPDLQSAFPDMLGADRDAFLNWTAQSGVREHAVSDRFLAHLLV